jgi:hypothetical protein
MRDKRSSRASRHLVPLLATIVDEPMRLNGPRAGWVSEVCPAVVYGEKACLKHVSRGGSGCCSGSWKRLQNVVVIDYVAGKSMPAAQSGAVVCTERGTVVIEVMQGSYTIRTQACSNFSTLLPRILAGLSFCPRAILFQDPCIRTNRRQSRYALIRPILELP